KKVKKTKKVRKIKKIIEVIQEKKLVEVYPKGFPEQMKSYDLKSENIWKEATLKFRVGETHLLRVKYLGIVIGHLKLKVETPVMIKDRKVNHFKAILKSEKFYSMIYSLEDTVDSYVDYEKFLPVKYVLRQRETGKEIDDLQLFDHEKFKSYLWYKKVKKKEVTQYSKSGFIPIYFQDIFSGVYFMRSLVGDIGMKYEFPVSTKTKLYLSTVFFEKKEIINIDGKKYKAIKIKSLSKFPGVDDKKDKFIYFWLSDDNSRKLLKVELKIKIGTAVGELVEYQR
ncbi:MAG: DUF3108 domain-containing protein, partial [Bdellovibrionales bacterium]|nr:DUF3108 domain-containing protein [Bdellovibrionales bacterium]